MLQTYKFTKLNSRTVTGIFFESNSSDPLYQEKLKLHVPNIFFAENTVNLSYKNGEELDQIFDGDFLTRKEHSKEFTVIRKDDLKNIADLEQIGTFSIEVVNPSGETDTTVPQWYYNKVTDKFIKARQFLKGQDRDHYKDVKNLRYDPIFRAEPQIIMDTLSSTLGALSSTLDTEECKDYRLYLTVSHGDYLVLPGYNKDIFNEKQYSRIHKETFEKEHVKVKTPV